MSSSPASSFVHHKSLFRCLFKKCSPRYSLLGIYNSVIMVQKYIDQKHFISKMWNEVKSSLFLFKIILNICASYMPTCFEEIFKVHSSVSLTEKCQEMI